MWCAGIGDAIPWLKRGTVPPCLAWESSARLLRAGEKIMFGEQERASWKVLMVAALISKESGFAADAGQALSEREEAVINAFLGWLEKTSAKVVDGQTGPDVSLLKDLDKSIKDSYALATKVRSDLHKGSACMLTADQAALSRNPFVDEHQPQQASLPDVWVHSHPQNGTMRTLLELLRCCRIEGTLTAMTNVLRVIAGPCFAEEDGLRMVKGSPNASFGAVVYFSAFGGALEATKHLNLWMQAVEDAPTAQNLRPLAVPQFIGAGKPKGGPPDGCKRYMLSLGDTFVPDAYIAQAIHAIQKACNNSNGGGDGAPRAMVEAYNIDLQLESGRTSAIYVDVKGEVSTRGRYLDSIHGKTATLQEVIVTPEMEQVFLYLENACRDQAGRQAIANMLLDKARLSDDGVEVSEDRDRRNIVIVGALFVRLSASKHKDFMRMVQQIDTSVPACNSGYIELSPDEAVAARVVGKNVKVYVGSSPSALMHALREAGVAWSEVGSGGGMANNAIAAELESFKQQAAEAERAAQERADQISQALQHVRAQATANMEAAETQVQSLRSDLRSAYELMEANRREEAAKVELNARRAEAERAAQMHQLNQIQQASATQAAVVMALLQGNPQVALGLRNLPALEGGNPAQVVVGQNGEDGELVFDVNALLAPSSGTWQGGAAASPLPEAVQAAQEAEQHALTELQRAQEARRAAHNLAAARVERPSGLSQEMRDADLDGARSRVVSGSAVGGRCNGQGRLQGRCTGGCNGDFECKRSLTHGRRPLSSQTADGGRRDEPLILHGTHMLRLVWAVIVVWALIRRMWRQLGRQYASVHKARRKKAVSPSARPCGLVVIGLVVRALATRGTLVASLEGSILSWGVGCASGCVVVGLQHDVHFPAAVTSPGHRYCNKLVTFGCNSSNCYICAEATVAGTLGAGNPWHATTTSTTTAGGLVRAAVDGRFVDGTCGGTGPRRQEVADGGTVDGADATAVECGSNVETVPSICWEDAEYRGTEVGTRGRQARCRWCRRRAGGTEWWQVQGGAPPTAVGVLLGDSTPDSHAMTRGERWPCGGPEAKAGPEAEDSVYPRGTSGYLAGCLRWTCCTGATDPDDRCCALGSSRGGCLGQGMRRGVAGGTIRRSIEPGYMNLAMATLLVVSYCCALGGGGGRRHAPLRGRWERREVLVFTRGGQSGARHGRRAVPHANRMQMVLILMWAWLAEAEAADEGGGERLMLFNTRGLAVSTAVAAAAGTAYFFTQAALDKLSFIATTLASKNIDAGVLLELMCNFKQAKYLAGWFRRRGYGLKVASGDYSEGSKGMRNSVAVFYRLRKFKVAKGDVVGKYKRCASDNRAAAATKIGERMLRVCLQRPDRSVLNLIAWHGCHNEAKFAAQMDLLADVAGSGCAAVVLGDVNRRLCTSQANRANALGAGDKRWAEFVGWGDEAGGCDAGEAAHVRLVPMLDEGEAAATRRAAVNGVSKWSILDRCLEMGDERLRWQLDEIIRPEVGGEGAREVSDHAAVCFERAVRNVGAGGEPKPKIPGVRKWNKQQHKRFRQLTRGVEERVRQAGDGNAAELMRELDAELIAAAELVDVEDEERREQRMHSDHDNYSSWRRWRWRLRRLLELKGCVKAVRYVSWLRYPRCELRHELRHFEGMNDGALLAALVRRCRRELAFFARVCNEDKARAERLLQRVAAAESHDDPLARAKLAFDMMRGRQCPPEKVAAVAIGDDPAKGFVTDPEGVRKEAAAIGLAAQEEYRDGNPSPAGAFDCFLEHFMEAYDELKAPDGSDFDLEKLLTFELFEAELYAHARYKAVGAKVGRALSSLELVRRLNKQEREAYFTVAKRCIVESKFPEHWQQMVYVLLPKKHGDQRKIRKKREIALMDQTLKLMLKCVKRLSFDRMVGRTGEENHGWVSGHGALNAALTMDAVLGQARELKHSIFILFLDLKQFFPAIKRDKRRAAEFFLGLPREVVRLARAVFERMTAKFDTAHGLSDSFNILGGDLMGCVLSPSHARCLLTSISVAIAAVSSGVRVWGCDKRVRQIAQTMMADDWAGFSTTEESLQAQWAIWVDYAMASGSPIGVAGLEKTVVTAARFDKGKWVDVPVKLNVPKGAGGFNDLPDTVPQMPLRDAYPHVGILRSISANRQHMRNKLKKGVAAIVSKVRKVKFDKGQHVTCANCLKGSYVGYYAAAYGLTMSEAEELEKVWRAAFRMIFKVHPSTPTAHFYGGEEDKVADSLHGRHVIVDAVGSLYSTCRRALASPEDSPERAMARSALARCARKWGCPCSPAEWLGSRAHLDTAVIMEREMESGRMAVEAFDFFILYTAWLTKQDVAIFDERRARGERPAPLRNVLSVEHAQDDWGEALLNDDHAAWANGDSRTLHEVLGRAAPASLLLAGITRVEHVCRPLALSDGYDFAFLSFEEAAKWWALPRSKRVHAEYMATIEALYDGYAETKPWFNDRMTMTRPMVRPRTARQLWDGVRLVGARAGVRDGWPVSGGRQVKYGGNAFSALLQRARATGLAVSDEQWAAALEESYPKVVKKAAVEWWDGAPRDHDRYGAVLVHAWPGADHREGGDRRVFGRRTISAEVAVGAAARSAELERWSVGPDGKLRVDGCMAGEGDAVGLPCVQLLQAATRVLLEESQAEVDTQREVTIRGAGEWAVHVESTKRILEDWKELQATYDIQYAAATDGGWQLNEKGIPQASAAVFREDGTVDGGALDPDEYPSSYECEMRALVEAARAWPTGARALVAVDARSPVMAVTKFREMHVNKRAEYYQDGMLDELLTELERMDLVVFYWLKGHSGAVPNEVADLHATRMLQLEPQTGMPASPRRHTSLTFAFDRRPFRWSAVRMTRHVNRLLRGKSLRSEWRGDASWDLRWGKGRAALKKTLHAAQTRRLLFGDAASYEGQCGARAQVVRCRCGAGFCNSEHWLFDCCLPAAREQRAALAAKVSKVNASLAAMDAGRLHEATASTVKILKGQGGSGAEARRVAFRWLVGCIPKPRVSCKEARVLAMQALVVCGLSLQRAVGVYKEAKEAFLLSERERARALGLSNRLLELVALAGPRGGAVGLTDDQRAELSAAPRGAGSTLGKLGRHHTWRQAVAALRGEPVVRRGCPDDWVRCAAEWGAALVLLRGIRRWLEKLTGRTEWGGERASKVGRMWGLAVSKCPDMCATRRKQQNNQARLAREARARQVEKDAAHFQMLMGVEGEGHITLAPGLEDVQVSFRRRRRVNWRPTGKRNRKGKRRRRAASGDYDASGSGSGSTDSEEESDDAASDYESSSGTGGDDTGFETRGGDDGNGGMGNETGLVVGDLLRIRWEEEEVWFRCRIVGMGDAGRTVQVAYLVDDRWGLYVHALDDVEWERWELGGAVDPGEADYDMDVWVADDELDHEAAAAASLGGGRRSGDGSSVGQGVRGSRDTSSTAHIAEVETEDEGEEGRKNTRAPGGRAGRGGEGGDGPSGFDWVVQAAPKGAGLKKRKMLLEALVELWGEAAEMEGGGSPAVPKKAVYKQMARMLSVKQVGAELQLLSKAGIVVVQGDSVRCSETRSALAKGPRRSGGGSTTGDADTERGEPRTTGMQSGDGNGSDARSTGGSGMSEETAATGRASRRAGKRRREVSSYVESEQESEDGDDGGWD